MKKIAVIGLGDFGYRVAVTLEKLGADVVAIDLDARTVEEIKNEVSLALILDATDEDALREQELEKMDAVVIALGDQFDRVVLISALLKQMGVRRIIARAVSPLQRKILTVLGVDELVSPTEEMGDRLAKLLMLEGGLNMLELGGDYEILEVRTPSSYEGMKVVDMRLREQFQINLITILRHEPKPHKAEGSFPIPQGVPRPESEIKKGDILVLFGKSSDIRRFLQT